jgi:hypothetical protein
MTERDETTCKIFKTIAQEKHFKAQHTFRTPFFLLHDEDTVQQELTGV